MAIAMQSAPKIASPAEPAIAEVPRAVEPARDALIDMRDIKLRLSGEDIYESLSFSVARGELMCVLGPSGCGKSTLLRLIGDLSSRPAARSRSAGERPRRRGSNSPMCSSRRAWCRGAPRSAT